MNKAHVTHPELKATFCLDILGVKKNPNGAMYSSLGVVTKGTIIEVNVSELGLVTPGGKVVWGKYAQVSGARGRRCRVSGWLAVPPMRVCCWRAFQRAGLADCFAFTQCCLCGWWLLTPLAVCVVRCSSLPGHQQPRERRLHQRSAAGVSGAAVCAAVAWRGVRLQRAAGIRRCPRRRHVSAGAGGRLRVGRGSSA